MKIISKGKRKTDSNTKVIFKGLNICYLIVCVFVLFFFPYGMEKISNKPRYSIGQGIRRKFKLENTSPQNRGHCKKPEGCLL